MPVIEPLCILTASRSTHPMDFKTLSAGAPWMSDGDRTAHRRMLTALRRFVHRMGVKETPLLALHAADLTATALLVGRMERELAGFAAGAGETMPNHDTRETDARLRALIALADAIGKTRERMRKAMKELEDYCTRAGTPIDAGIADIMKPIVKKADGVLEEILREDSGDDTA